MVSSMFFPHLQNQVPGLASSQSYRRHSEHMSCVRSYLNGRPDEGVERRAGFL